MRASRPLSVVMLAAALVLAACGGTSAPTASPTGTPTADLTPSPTATATPAITPTPLATPSLAPTASPTLAPTLTTAPTNSPTPTTTAVPTPTAGSTSSPAGDVTFDAPLSVPAGAQFEVGWTGPGGLSDFVSILPAGTAAWTNESYFSTRTANPGLLVAPTEGGAYELSYHAGSNNVYARRPITVEPFAGDLTGPTTVMAGTEFEVGWSGPNGPGDFVTIVALGATRWTNEEWFATAVENPGLLVAPVEAGAHELWYVAGRESRTMIREPISVTPYVITLDAPDTVRPNRGFRVQWTGPDGPGDYITIVAVGAPVGSFGAYEYTSTGSPANLIAPATAGSYEIRYVSDRVPITFASIPINVE